MNRNEYRRAFIMLRAVEAGYSGHARLERRTITGSLYFIVGAPEAVGELQAALVGHRNGEMFAAPVGTLRRDRRGQLTLARAFDPRDIAGRPLEAYRWVAVARGGEVALTGNVEGSYPLDLAALRRAVRALYAGGGATADATVRTELDAGRPTRAATPAAADVSLEALMPAEGTFSPEAAGRDLAPAGSGAADAGRAADSGISAAGAANDAGSTVSETDLPDGGGNAAAPERAVDSVGTVGAERATDDINAVAPARAAEALSDSPSLPEGRGDARAPAADPQASDGEMRGDVKVYRPTRARLYTAMRPPERDNVGAITAKRPQEPSADDEPAASSAASSGAEAGGRASRLSDPPVNVGAIAAAQASEREDAVAITSARLSERDDTEGVAVAAPSDAGKISAAQALGLDITSPWPGALEPLRKLFATQAPQPGAPDDGHTYVRAPLPAGGGFPACYIGLRAEGGRVTGVRYALPGGRAPKPPAGLERYRWTEGGGAGWWTLDASPDGDAVQN